MSIIYMSKPVNDPSKNINLDNLDNLYECLSTNYKDYLFNLNKIESIELLYNDSLLQYNKILDNENKLNEMILKIEKLDTEKLNKNIVTLFNDIYILSRILGILLKRLYGYHIDSIFIIKNKNFQKGGGFIAKCLPVMKDCMSCFCQASICIFDCFGRVNETVTEIINKRLLDDENRAAMNKTYKNTLRNFPGTTKQVLNFGKSKVPLSTICAIGWSAIKESKRLYPTIEAKRKKNNNYKRRNTSQPSFPNHEIKRSHSSG